MSLKQLFWSYSEFVKTCLTRQMSFRISFVCLIFMDIFAYASGLFSIDFIFNYTEFIGPWNRETFLFFVAYMMCLDQLHMMLISESFWELAFKIRTGELDFDLLRPISTIYNVFFRYFRPSALVSGFISYPILIYFGLKINLDVLSWILLPLLLLLSFSLAIGLEIILSVSMFWLIDGTGINFLRMQLQELEQFPRFVYQYWPRKILTFAIPVLLVGSAPVEFLINHNQYSLLIGLLIANVVVLGSLKFFWNFGLTHYESPSS